MRLCLILFLVSFVSAKDLSVQSPDRAPTALPVEVDCSKRAQCAGQCVSPLGREGSCIGTGDGKCFCQPIVDTRLVCKCEGAAKKNELCQYDCEPKYCKGEPCYEGQQVGSKCRCRSTCYEFIAPQMGVRRQCACDQGTCIDAREVIATETVEEGLKY